MRRTGNGSCNCATAGSSKENDEARMTKFEAIAKPGGAKRRFVIRRMMADFRFGLTVIFSLGLLSLTSSVSAGEVLEDVVERRFPLDPSGTFSLRAIDGTVEIFGTDSREVKIVAI